MLSKFFFLLLLSLALLCLADDNNILHGRGCPAMGTFSTANERNVRLELLVDDAFTSDPIAGDNTAGFANYLGFSQENTRTFFYTGLRYIKWRFGVDGTACAFDPVSMSCYLGPDPRNPTSGWIVVPAGDPRTTVAITPVTYSAGDTYRVVRSNSPLITVVPELQQFPTVRLAQWILTFLAPVNISGNCGAELSPSTGYFTLNLDPGLTVGDGVAFGRYVICAQGRNFSFDMRSWVVSRRWQAYAPAQSYYYTEKFQLGSLQTEIIPDGHGTLEIVYPSGPIPNAQGQNTYPWYVSALWNLGVLISHPSYNNWNVACGSACNTKNIPAH